MKSHIHSRRRGSMYVMVLGTSMAVTVIGLSALMVVRIERRSVEGGTDFSETRFHARSAIETGLLLIEERPDWRTAFPNGTWLEKQPIGSGTYTLEGIDPNDGDLSNDSTGSLVLTGIGMQGDARYKLQVTLTAETNPLSCLEVSLHAGTDLSFAEPSTVYGDQIISANNMIKATGFVTVFPSMEAVNGFAGSLVPGTQTLLTTPRVMPDPATVFDFYDTNGTAIDMFSLPTIDGTIRYLQRVLLSPANNPYGAANPQGIYVIDCKGVSLSIEDCRIVGTLVIKNPGNSTGICGPVTWEPGVANYPSLLVAGSFRFITPDALLREEPISVNFNPPGTPYEGSTNESMIDTYPSVINGLIYISGNAEDTSSLTRIAVNGVLIVGGTLTTAPSSSKDPIYLDFTYNSKYYDNPPPGFTGGGGIKIVEGSWRQAVD